MDDQAHIPDGDNALLAEAQALQGTGNHAQAIAILRQLVNRHATNPRLLHLAGSAELQAGHYVQSIELLRKSLNLDPNQADTLSHLGVALGNLRNFTAAKAAYRAAIQLNPEYAEAYNNLSITLLDGHSPPEAALAAAEKALALKPNYADAYINHGNALQALRRFDAALESYDRAIVHNPNSAVVHNNRGNALRKLNRLADALSAYQDAIRLKPDYAQAYCNMGVTLADLGHEADSRYFFQRTLMLDPASADAHFNMGLLSHKTSNYELALACLDRSIALNPDFADAYWNKAFLKLLMGDFPEGFVLYEWGWKSGMRLGSRDFNEPLWLGKTPLAGKRLLIHHEQGIGDCIQYARYVQLAVEMDAEVILETPAPLVPLLKTLTPACELVVMGDPLPRFDYYIPLMSLPLAFGTTLDHMPPSAPYLSTEPLRVATWAQRLGSHAKPRVGLVWSGSTLHQNDHNRSLALKELLPFLSLPIEFHCLQKEIREEDANSLAALPMIRTHCEAINDFADTAAIVSLMDLVISVDTSVAHLAGAMGKPVWILLPAAPDWRWLLTRKDSPWYPSARLFRQAQPGRWDAVVTKVRAALSETLMTSRNALKNRKLQKRGTSDAIAFANRRLQEGIRLLTDGKAAEAYGVFTALVQQFPREFSLHNRAGLTAFALGNLEDAAKHLEDALSCDPKRADTVANLGVIYRRLKRYDDALACQKKAIEINPNYAEAHCNLGLLMHEAFQQPEAAIAAYKKAISLNPKLQDAYYNLGNVYMRRKDFKAAIPLFEQALSIRPDYGSALANMAICYGGLKNYPEAVKNYQKAVELRVPVNFLQGHYLYTKLHVGDWSGFDGLVADLTRDIMAGKPVSAPFAVMALVDDPQVQQRAIETFAGSEYPPKNELPLPTPHPEHARIKIGYFSTDYWNHPVAHLMLGLFAAHDRNRFEVIAFSLGNPIKDKWHQRVKDSVDQFIEIQDLSDKEVAELARSMEIDVAVDLNGFTENCRAGIFAHRAAPVQVSYIGYLGTMGAPYIDYLVTDETIVPAEARPFYNEKMIYLPSYQINDPEQHPSDRPMTRAEFGLPDDAFVFCAFNNNYKITPPVFEIWMRILNRVPHGVLWLFVSNEKAQENLRAFAAAHGVDPGRLIFAKKILLEDHLARQRLGDLFLDTLPYNAGATASNALRVGLPVLTRTGKSFAGRMGSSLLKAVGLPELVTATEQAYEDKAVELASDPALMQSIREKLAANLPSSALFDNQAFARHIETAFTTIHNRACQGLPPMHVKVQG
jgi:predicted O-linked N-acetylglucosamine transferase (SPINDLY family)